MGNEACAEVCAESAAARATVQAVGRPLAVLSAAAAQAVWDGPSWFGLVPGWIGFWAWADPTVALWFLPPGLLCFYGLVRQKLMVTHPPGRPVLH